MLTYFSSNLMWSCHNLFKKMFFLHFEVVTVVVLGASVWLCSCENQKSYWKWSTYLCATKNTLHGKETEVAVRRYIYQDVFSQSICFTNFLSHMQNLWAHIYTHTQILSFCKFPIFFTAFYLDFISIQQKFYIKSGHYVLLPSLPPWLSYHLKHSETQQLYWKKMEIVSGSWVLPTFFTGLPH